MKKFKYSIYTFPLLFTLLFSLPAVSRDKTVNDYSYYIGFSAFGSLFSDMDTMSNNAVGYGETITAGARVKNLGSYLKISTDRWLSAETSMEIKKGVLNFAFGFETLLFENRIRMSIEMGTSTLRFNTAFDEKGSTGIYAGFNPGALRWYPGKKKKFVIELTPFMLAVQKPVLKQPVILRVEYRTVFGIEVPF
jgi:hypothetical protein